MRLLGCYNYVPVAFAELRHAEQSKIGDDHLAILKKYVFGLQIFVDDTTGVQVSHSLKHTKDK